MGYSDVVIVRVILMGWAPCMFHIGTIRVVTQLERVWDVQA